MPARLKIEEAIESLQKAQDALNLAELTDPADGHRQRARLELEDSQYLVAEAIKELGRAKA